MSSTGGSFSLTDHAVIGVYFVVLFAAGLAFLRRERTTESYFVAGRTVTLPAFVATLVSTWYGGILGIGEYAHQYGLSAWVVFGVPYYAFALVFALWLAPRIRSAQLYTIPDKLDERYGRPAALLGGAYIFLMTNPAAYVLMLGVLLQLVYNVPLLPAMIVGVLLSTVYVYSGGFRADVRVNIVQFVLMFGGFALILPYCGLRLGNLHWLRDTLVAQGAANHLTWHGGNSTQTILVWFFIALWTLVDPGFHQRCYAAKTPRTAQMGVLVSILFWIVFDAMTNTAGLYARAALPAIDPKDAYPLLANLVLPPVAKGIFYVGMLATVMSTLVSNAFLCGVTFSRDLVWRLRGGDEEAQTARWTGLGLLLTSLVAILLAWQIPSVVKIWMTIGSVFVPGLLVPLLAAYRNDRNLTPPLAVVSMALASAASLVWMLWGQWHMVNGEATYPLPVEPMYPGLLVSVVVYGIGWATSGRAEHPLPER